MQKDMQILSLGTYRSTDGLTLAQHEEASIHDEKLTEARTVRTGISQKLSHFQDSSRYSLYLDDSKYSIHWMTSTLERTSLYYDKPHCHTTPSKSRLSKMPSHSFVIIALCQNIKRTNCEESIFKALDSVDKSFEKRYTNSKIAQAQQAYQYEDFAEHLSKIKIKFQKNKRSVRQIDAKFRSSLSTNPICNVRHDVVQRILYPEPVGDTFQQVGNYQSDFFNSRQIVPAPESSRAHNLKNNPHSLYGADSAVGTSISSGHTMNDHPYYESGHQISTNLKSRSGHLPPSRDFNPYFSRPEFENPCEAIFIHSELNSYCKLSLVLVILAGVLNFSRAWHFFTYTGEHFIEDLWHGVLFIISAFFCLLQFRLLVTPSDCVMRTLGRHQFNWLILIGLIGLHLVLAEHRTFVISIFHAVINIGTAGGIHISRGTKSKNAREMA